MAQQKREVSREDEQRYLNLLQALGGDDLETAGKGVLADWRSGKEVRPPKAEKPKSEKGISGKKQSAKTPVVGVMHLAHIDPKVLAQYGLCLAQCVKHVSNIQKAACVLFCLGIGVPPV